MGQNSGQSHILQGLMGGSVGPYGDARMGPTEADLQIVVADGGPDLVEGPAGEEDSVMSTRKE